MHIALLQLPAGFTYLVQNDPEYNLKWAETQNFPGRASFHTPCLWQIADSYKLHDSTQDPFSPPLSILNAFRRP